MTVDPHRVEPRDESRSFAAVEAGPGDDRLVNAPIKTRACVLLSFSCDCSGISGSLPSSANGRDSSPPTGFLDVIAAKRFVTLVDDRLGVDCLLDLVAERAVVGLWVTRRRQRSQ